MKRIVSILIVSLWTLSFAQGGTFQLQILHSSDNESALQDPNTLEETALNYAAVVNGLRALAPGGNTLHLTAGDHTLPGPFYEAAAQIDSLGARGLADIALYNAMGLVANGIGNHEFDGGIDDFARMLAGASYPFIAVNLDFRQVQVARNVPPIEVGVDGGSASENAGKVVKSAYVEVGGERIGLIGRAPADFFNVIEDPATTLPGLDFVGGRDSEANQPLASAVAQVLEQVDVLKAQGIDKIILLDHAQDFTADPLSVQLLRDIDVIIAAGSTGFMARPSAQGPFNLLRSGDAPQADYPTLRRDSQGVLVAVVNSDQQYRYVGNLMLTFDADGQIVRIDNRSGPVATTGEGIAALAEVLGYTPSPPDRVVNVFRALQETDLIRDAFEVIGTTSTALNGARADVRSRETNLGRLAADSTLWFTRREFPQVQPDIALKNGGGIRATIQGPNITRLNVDAALAFDNRIDVVELTAAELLATMENAVSRVPALDGRFPQVAGLVLEYDPNKEGLSDQTSLTTPSRVKNLSVTRVDGSTDVLVADFEAQGDLERTFVVATNSFLLTGGDGYQGLKAAAEARGSVTTEEGERQVLTDYITEVLAGMVDLLDPDDEPRVVQVGE
ncbi:MAG: bifunctional metallophosphatase/5'-nucleotidase [Trueperaceae bacterium]|nr:MAG: bifunctional metallophosphatase/5'-nucleotidase [Trueperaceae bacterium]